MGREKIMVEPFTERFVQAKGDEEGFDWRATIKAHGTEGTVGTGARYRPGKSLQ